MKVKYLRYYHFMTVILKDQRCNVRLLKELPFYDDLSTVKNKTTFSGYLVAILLNIQQFI